MGLSHYFSHEACEKREAIQGMVCWYDTPGTGLPVLDTHAHWDT